MVFCTWFFILFFALNVDYVYCVCTQFTRLIFNFEIQLIEPVGQNVPTYSMDKCANLALGLDVIEPIAWISINYRLVGFIFDFRWIWFEIEPSKHKNDLQEEEKEEEKKQVIRCHHLDEQLKLFRSKYREIV